MLSELSANYSMLDLGFPGDKQRRNSERKRKLLAMSGTRIWSGFWVTASKELTGEEIDLTMLLEILFLLVKLV